MKPSLETAVTTVLKKLRPVSFKYKKQNESKFSNFGFIAQEIQEVLPTLVRESEDGYLALRNDDLVAVLTLGIQASETAVKRVDAKVASLAAKIDVNYMDLSGRLKSIEYAIRKLLAVGSSLGKRKSHAATTALHEQQTQDVVAGTTTNSNNTGKIPIISGDDIKVTRVPFQPTPQKKAEKKATTTSHPPTNVSNVAGSAVTDEDVMM